MQISSDCVHTLRGLWKRPWQSLIIVVILAIGVGASSAFYSVSDALVLRPLPFDHADNLVDIEQQLEPSRAPLMNSHQNLNDLREQSRMLDGVAVYQGAYASIAANGEPEFAQGMAVDRYFFPLLSVAPVIGRGFTVEDEQDGSPCTIILSHVFWRRRFSSDPSITGKTIQLDKKLCTVIGIMPQSFFFPFSELGVAEEDFWLPLRDHSSLRENYDKYGIGRIKPGGSLREAQSEIKLIATHVSHTDRGHESHIFLLRPYREVLVADYVPMIRLLGGILACFLLIVCINVAGLMLVEAMRSRKEIEIRFALGGQRWQILRVFLFRALALASAGGMAGFALAWILVRLTRELLSDQFPHADQIVLNARVFWFTAGVALGTGVLSGVLPALASTRKLHQISLARFGIHLLPPSMHRSRSYLVVLQLAVSATLLVVTGLLGVSLYRLLNIDPGMQLDHRLVLILKPTDSDLKTADALQGFVSRIEERVLSTPGVDAVAVSSDAPLGAHGSRSFRIQDMPPPKDSRSWIAQARAVGPNYFRELGIAMRLGRSFDEKDHIHGKPVVIINELFAKRFLAGKSPLGRQICSPSGNDCLWREIVGVVADVRDSQIDSPPEPAYFVPFVQAPNEYLGNAVFTVRTSIAPLAVQQSIHIPTLAPGEVSPVSFTLEELRSRQTIAPRARVWIVAAIAFLAVLLAAIGVYGIVAGIVEQRRHEIGIRMAMGASRQTITSLFMRKMLLMLVPGILIGTAAAAIVVRSVTSFLFETSAISPVAYCGAALILSIVAAMATSLPVRRALQGNPCEALRAE